MESINILRLKSGEDIICYMENYGQEEIAVRDAMVVFVKMDMKTGKQHILLDHWLPLPIIKENEAIIRQSEILAVMVPTKEFTEYYENSVAVIKHVKENVSNEELSSSDDDELTQEDMRMMLDTLDELPTKYIN